MKTKARVISGISGTVAGYLLGVGCLLAAWPALAAFESVELTTNVSSPQPAGSVITLTATPMADDPGSIVYRFETRAPGGAWKMLQDYRANDTFEWVSLQEDNYEVRVLARDESTGETRASAKRFGLVSRGKIAGQPVLTPTSHPLVVIYSAPPCLAGAIHRVRYWINGTQTGNVTNFKPCRSNKGVNHYVAGMRSNTPYLMRQEVFSGGNFTPGPILGVVSGTPLLFQQDYGVYDPPDASTSFNEPVHLMGYIAPQADGNFMRASDLTGRMIWSWGQDVPGVQRALLVRPVAGGTFMIIVTEPDGIQSQILREIDLAGHTVRETNIDEVNRQLEALGETQLVGSFHHEARRLPNGHTLVLASTEKILTDVQGPGDVNVYGEAILDLDPNMRVSWYWDAFQHIDNADMAANGEVCQSGSPGCPPLFLGPEANDWLHMNAIAYSPADGHLILSARHQDAVYKVDYANGTGTGAVVWELGRFGDFQLDAPGEVWPWFSHQHDPNYVGGNRMVIYDNGNMRWDELGTLENSRGQVYELDEVNGTVTLLHNFDLGVYSAAVGSAQPLANGNYHFINGFVGTNPAPEFDALEVTPAATVSWAIAGSGRVYRSHRMRSMYQQ